MRYFEFLPISVAVTDLPEVRNTAENVALGQILVVQRFASPTNWWASCCQFTHTFIHLQSIMLFKVTDATA